MAMNMKHDLNEYKNADKVNKKPKDKKVVSMKKKERKIIRTKIMRKTPQQNGWQSWFHDPSQSRCRRRRRCNEDCQTVETKV